MALHLRILSGESADEASSLTLDGPRIVIGRAKSCDVQLLDQTVSARHAVIRLEGGSNLIADEGSTNGTAVGRVRLPPHTPRVVADGERVRVGRVWLELSLGAGMASSPREVQAAALAHLRRELSAAGEEVEALLEVAEGPDAGSEVALPFEGEVVIGRARDADLQLTDPSCSRRHVAVCRRGEGFEVRDLGSKPGAWLNDAPLGAEPVKWQQGAKLRLGQSVVTLRDPLPELAEEIRAGADVAMKQSELEASPPGTEERVVDAPDEYPETLALPEPSAPPPVVVEPAAVDSEPPSAWSVTVDLLVALVALALLAVSGFGLMYVLG